MKKLTHISLLFLLAMLLLFSATACGGKEPPKEPAEPGIYTLSAAYDVAVRNGFDGTLAEFTEAIRGLAIEFSTTDTAIRWRYEGTETWYDLVALSKLVGPKGDQGEKGDTGATGPKGDQGEKGDKGDTGATGPKGDQGEKGDTGATGPKGDQGEKGDTGATGPKGDQGEKGDTGATGPKGDQGEKGDTGATGPKGDQGEKGDKGDTGATGPKGDQGEKGDKGDTGATGPKGDQGEKGDTGATGPKGDRGEKGDTGRGILKIEVIDGVLWVTYTDDPDHPVRIGEISESEEGTEGLDFYPLPDGTYGVMGGKTKYLSDIVIPATHKGKAVTRILPSAFQDASKLTNIILPKSVTSIGESAFSGCEGLSSITIPDSVRSIGGGAFSGCKGLTSVTIPGSVASIGNDAFYGCSGLEEAHISDLTAWCGISFDSCSANPLTYAHNLYLNGSLVTELAVPDSVTSIGKYTFSGCSSLTSVTIPDSMTSIGESAFSECSGLTSITIPFVGATKGGTSNTHFAYIFGSICSTLKTVVITGESKINDSAFSGCSGLTSITIPDSVTSIGESAFSGCEGLSSITIPDSVTSIGDNAFSGCKGLTSVTIPDSVTSIGKSAFSECSGLASITIPFVGATKDGSSNTSFAYIFGGVYETLKTVVITGGSKISDNAFKGCTRLVNITIPNSVTYIGKNAFYGCTGLTNITIPNSVTGFGDYAFCESKGLTSITFKGTKAQWNAIYKGTFWNLNTGHFTIHCTDGVIS